MGFFLPTSADKLHIMDTFDEWKHGRRRWQDIAVGDHVIVGRGRGARLGVAGLETLGEVDAATDTRLLGLAGIGPKTLRRIRKMIQICKEVEACGPRAGTFHTR